MTSASSIPCNLKEEDIFRLPDITVDSGRQILKTVEENCALLDALKKARDEGNISELTSICQTYSWPLFEEKYAIDNGVKAGSITAQEAQKQYTDLTQKLQALTITAKPYLIQPAEDLLRETALKIEECRQRILPQT
jgi:hypothetical protein